MYQGPQSSLSGEWVLREGLGGRCEVWMRVVAGRELPEEGPVFTGLEVKENKVRLEEL